MTRIVSNVTGIIVEMISNVTKLLGNVIKG